MQQNLGEREKLQIKRTTYLIILQFHGAATASKLVLKQTIFEHSLKLISRVICDERRIIPDVFTNFHFKVLICFQSLCDQGMNLIFRNL